MININKENFEGSDYIKIDKNQNEQDLYEIDEVKIIIEFMEGKLNNKDEDISWEWVEKDNNIQFLSKCIKADLSSMRNIVEKRDMMCELKLLKLLTEDKKHKEKLIELPKEYRKYNRYPDILPYAKNTVFLKDIVKKSNIHDENEKTPIGYINASYISGPLPEDNFLFIATQAPKVCTIEMFWKMVMIKNIKLIIMLSNIEEEGRIKCDIYWPQKKDSPIVFENFKIILENEVFILDNAVLQRNFLIIDEQLNTKQEITQLHVICWPDHSIPEEEVGFKMIELIVSFTDDIRSYNKNSPVLVHCSAGIGRTGTFIAIYILCKSLTILNNYNKNCSKNGNKILPSFSVFNVVRKLKEQRYGMVTDSSQYKYIYQFVCEWLNRNYEI